MQRLKQLFSKRAHSPIEIYTDGGVKNSFGAWSFVIVQNQKIIVEKAAKIEISDCNQVELQAAIEALKALSPKTNATLYSDSRILIDSITLWMNEWRKNNWLKKKGYPLPYAEQLKELDRLNQMHNLKWKWVRSHSGNQYNERCDELCRISLENNKLSASKA